MLWYISELSLFLILLCTINILKFNNNQLKNSVPTINPHPEKRRNREKKFTFYFLEFIEWFIESFSLGIILFLENIGWSTLVEYLFCLVSCILYLMRVINIAIITKGSLISGRSDVDLRRRLLADLPYKLYKKIKTKNKKKQTKNKFTGFLCRIE